MKSSISGSELSQIISAAPMLTPLNFSVESGQIHWTSVVGTQLNSIMGVCQLASTFGIKALFDLAISI